ncbi:hypothetical protein [Lacinutrix sp. Hel_I_90]|uniref:hypothetical protein n=1 Tax=Lacinutrix sp. Hel_I_90 TaxID=1249999 RepID=UPI0005C89746|nr:hypothetical protein [Lacinutrix sp. Hel_I_90]
MKQLLIPIITLLISVNAYSQRPDKEKVKALKIAHITEQLDLTAKEAQAFWPVYNANEDAREKLRATSKFKRPESIDALTEAEAKTHLEGIVSLELAKQQLEKKYYTELKEILSAKKILKLMDADRSFRRKLIEEFKERHRGERSHRKKQ